jgi:hypothetical protein
LINTYDYSSYNTTHTSSQSLRFSTGDFSLMIRHVWVHTSCDSARVTSQFLWYDTCDFTVLMTQLVRFHSSCDTTRAI